jgi:hypothetical protein
VLTQEGLTLVCTMDWLPGITLTNPQRNLVELVGIAATVAAAWFAFWSIRKSGKQAKRAAGDLVRERRLDFELDLLTELAELLTGSPFVVTVHAAVELRLSMLPPDEFSLCRDAFGVNGPEAYQLLEDEVKREPGEHILQALMSDGRIVGDCARQEVLNAIDKRLSERA